jgi:hypothetical protein
MKPEASDWFDRDAGDRAATRYQDCEVRRLSGNDVVYENEGLPT